MTWRRPWGLQVSWERCLRFFFFTIHLEILVQIHMYHLTYSIVLECDLKTNHLPRAGSKLGSFLNLYTKIPPKQFCSLANILHLPPPPGLFHILNMLMSSPGPLPTASAQPGPSRGWRNSLDRFPKFQSFCISLHLFTYLVSSFISYSEIQFNVWCLNCLCLSFCGA